MLSPRLAPAVLIFAVMGWIAPLAGAQDSLYSVDTKPPRGFMPTADQLSSPVDNIDAVNGKLHLQIPLGSVPKTRGGFGFDLDLVYDSHLYDIEPDVEPGVAPIPPNPPNRNFQYANSPTLTGNWTYSVNNIYLDTEQEVGVCSGNPAQPQMFRLRLFLPDGSAHILEPAGFESSVDSHGFADVTLDGGMIPCPDSNNVTNPRKQMNSNGWMTFYSTDSSYLKLDVRSTGSDLGNHTWVVNYPDGRRIVHLGGDSASFENCPLATANTCLFDANGNRIQILTFTDGTGMHTTVSDDTGRQVKIDYSVQFVAETSKQDRVTAPGPNGSTITWLIDWEYLVLGDGQRQYIVTYDAPLDGSQSQTIGFAFWVVTDIQLPQPVGTSYAFKYDGDSRNVHTGYGELNFMQTPTGSTYTYGWKNDNFCPTPPACLDAVGIAQNNSVTSRTIAHDSTSDTWTYSIGNVLGRNTFTNPDGSQTTYQFDMVNQDLVFEIDGPNGAVTQRTWAANPPPTFASGNPFIKREGVTPDTGITRETAITDYSYDQNGNVLQRTEYDWVPYSPSNFSTVAPTPKRTETFSYFIAAPQAGSTSNFSQGYWQPNTNFTNVTSLAFGDARRLNAVKVDSVSPDGTFSNSYSATYFSYDDYLRNGNATMQQRWKSSIPGTPSQASSVTTTRVFDPFGNLTDIFEPSSNGEPPRQTHIEYNNGSPDFPSDVFYAYQAPEQRHWQYAFDSGAALVNTKKDADNGLTTTYGYDGVGRQTLADEAGVRQTTTQYDDQNLKVTVKRDLQTHGDGQLQAVTHYDQLGRVRLVRTSDGTALSPTSENDGIKVETSYSTVAGGSCTVTSTPYRSKLPPSVDPSLEWTQTLYDALSRVATVSTFSSEPTCQSAGSPTGVTQTTYDFDVANGLARTHTTDPAGKTRDTETDALGRLTRVVEDPGASNYVTSYSYDPLGNLRQVFQGVQTRTFTYDTLSRLTAATNPESGTSSYAYYDSGDLLTRTDARHIATNYSYDGLHRLSMKSYINDPFATPVASYSYYAAGSGAPPNIGQLQSVTSTAGSMQYSYDPLGRVTGTTQSITGYPGALPFAYSYWLNDTLKTMTYPSGNVVNYNDDNAGRPVTVFTSTKTYADLSQAPASLPSAPDGYAPDGRISEMKLGNQLWDTRNYQAPNPSLTPTKFMLGTAAGGSDYLELDYTFSGTQNNGNLVSHTIKQPGHTWTQTYTYDALNRIASFNEGSGWSQNFGCDQYGNCWVSSFTGLTGTDVHQPIQQSNFQGPAGVVTNQLWVAGSSYDAAGNQTTYTPFTLGYDAENRNVSTISQGNGSGTASYDADGRRIKKVWTAGSTTTTTYYFYDAFGNVAAEYSTQPIAVTGTTYLHTDLLGSVRMVTGDQPSGGTASVLECYDYLPYGRMLNSNDNGRNTGCYPAAPDYQLSSVVSQKFTGQNRDPETRLDFFGPRYMSPAQGRFMSPDPLGGHVEDPQTFNRYGYVRNNPTTLTDPTGLDFYLQCAQTDSSLKTCQRMSDGSSGNQTIAGTTDGNGHFNPTIVTSASLQNSNSGNTATVNENGIQITTSGQTYNGIFINGTPAADLNGSGAAFANFSFHVNGSDLSQGLFASGTFDFKGSPQAAESQLLSGGSWNSLFDPLDSDPILGFHPGTDQFRFGSGPSTHVEVPTKMMKDVYFSLEGYPVELQQLNPNYTVPTRGDFHVDGHVGMSHVRDAICAKFGALCR